MLQALRHSVLVKVFGLIALTVLLCFPLAEIDSLNRERGRSQQEAVLNLAVGLGWGIAVVPIATILLFWLVPRLRFTRRAATTRRLVRAGITVDLLALRALTNQKLSVFAAIDADPVSAWRRGDAEVMRSLAALELKASGVRIR